ncbi:MAG: radical SAM family heme chaperone HemW [Microcoleaceae cyanobacterium]
MFPHSAYIHIPFCRRRCFYCDFPVSVMGDRAQGENSGTITEYVKILCQEITTTITPKEQPLETIFFGGGTPSLLSLGQLSQILTTLDGMFGISRDAEISLEIDPGTFSLDDLYGYKALGINRFSLGIQAFQDELLAKSGRSHTVKEIYDAVNLVHQAGIVNFSLDLISGLPHQTLQQYQVSLQNAIGLNPTHLSCYDLIVEPKTVFARYYQPGSHPLPSDETTAQMYRLSQEILTKSGYVHYEISNYAKPGYQSRHNRVYWENRPYYGFGMGATSYVEGIRVTRPRKRLEYYNWVSTLLTPQNQLNTPPQESHSLKSESNDILLETLMLGLRLAEGLKIEILREKFGHENLKKVWNSLQPYYQCGWVEILNPQGQKQEQNKLKLPSEGDLRLSDPEGFLFSNTVLAALFRDFT